MNPQRSDYCTRLSIKVPGSWPFHKRKVIIPILSACHSTIVLEVVERLDLEQ
jgi:hypothetical protein